MLNSIISSTGVSVSDFLLCSGISIILGLVIAIVYRYTSKYSKNFLITLVVLPVLVQTIIFMTSGSLGTSIAIVGTFSLVKFRSLPGTSKEIMSIIFAMAIGLATGVGQLLFAIIVTIMVSILIIILSKSKFGDTGNNQKILKIVIPEDMDYQSVFDDVFKKYLKNVRLDSVKTINMGSLFELTYMVDLNNNINEKEFIDEIRVRNGNLKIMLSHPITMNEL